MRQLKGKVKETRKEKSDRRKENREIQDKVKTLVLPCLAAAFVFIVLYVYTKSRPQLQY